MKSITKKSLVFATAVGVLFFAAPGAKAGGVHNIRTKISKESKDSQAEKFSSTRPSKKFIAHKRRKSPKNKQSKDRSTSDFSMATQKDV